MKIDRQRIKQRAVRLAQAEAVLAWLCWQRLPGDFFERARRFAHYLYACAQAERLRATPAFWFGVDGRMDPRRARRHQRRQSRTPAIVLTINHNGAADDTEQMRREIERIVPFVSMCDTPRPVEEKPHRADEVTVLRSDRFEFTIAGDLFTPESAREMVENLRSRVEPLRGDQ